MKQTLDDIATMLGNLSLREYVVEKQRIERGEPMKLMEASLIQTPNGSFRWRRGVLVRIPDEWRGKGAVGWPECQINKRQSKQVRRGRAKSPERLHQKITCEEDQDATRNGRPYVYKQHGRMDHARQEMLNSIYKINRSDK